MSFDRISNTGDTHTLICAKDSTNKTKLLVSPKNKFCTAIDLIVNLFFVRTKIILYKFDWKHLV